MNVLFTHFVSSEYSIVILGFFPSYDYDIFDQLSCDISWLTWDYNERDDSVGDVFTIWYIYKLRSPAVDEQYAAHNSILIELASSFSENSAVTKVQKLSLRVQ